MTRIPQQTHLRPLITLLLITAVMLLQACSSGGGGPTPTYTVGGAVTGLGNTPVVLQNNNGAETLSISTNTTYTFTTALTQGIAYNITVLTQPTGYSCSVSNGAGTVGSQNIINIDVSCAALPTYTVGGSVTGLGSNPVVVQNNSEQLSISQNGDYQFVTAQLEGSNYNVTILTQPTGYSCSVSNDTGSVAQQNITTIVINCGVVATGYYTGSADVKADNNTTNLNIPDLRAMVNGDRLMLMSLNQQLLYDGTISITGSSYSGSVTLYKSGARISTTPIVVSGTITTGSNIAGTLAGSGAGNGTFSVLYDSLNTQAASLARVVSTVERSYWGGAFYLPYASDTRLMFKATSGGVVEHVDGAIVGYFSDCRFEGNSITPVANSSLYLFDITFSSCDEVARRSNYTGLVTNLSVTTAPTVGDLVLVALSNGESAGFAEFVYREY